MGKQKKKKFKLSLLDTLTNEFPSLHPTQITSFLSHYYDSTFATEAIARLDIQNIHDQLDAIALALTSPGTQEANDESFARQLHQLDLDAVSNNKGYSAPMARSVSTASSVTMSRDDDQQRLDFLTSVFPTFDPDYLQMRLNDHPGIVDLEAILEELLNELFISDLIEPPRDQTPARVTYYAVNAIKEGEQKKQLQQARRKDKVGLKAANTFSLTSTPRGIAISPAPPPSSSISSTSASPSIPSTPVWGVSLTSPPSKSPSLLLLPSISYKLSPLLSLAPAPLSILLQTPKHPLSSIFLNIALDRPRPPSEDINTLLEILPGASWGEAEMLLKCCGGLVGNAFELNELVVELGGLDKVLFPLEEGEDQTTSSRVVEPPFSLADYTETKSRSKQGGKPKFSTVAQDTAYDEKCRTLAEECRFSMSLATSKAFKAFLSKDPIESAKWVREIKETNARQRVWNGKAKLSGARSASDNVIDLHGFTVAEALPTISQALSEWWSSTNQSSSSAAASSFRIITGAGNNSPQMKSVLQPKVIALLNKEGWKWEYDHRTLSHADGIGRAGGVTVVGIVEKKAY